MLKLDLSKLATFLPQDYAAQRQDRLAKAAQMLDTHTGPGGDFTGWVYLPRDYDKEEFARIQAAAQKIQSQSKALVVIGIGGSYLGARAVIELLKPKSGLDIYFAGNGLSTDALLELIAADPAFNLSLEELQKAMDGKRYVGRAPKQVEEFLEEVIRPVLEENKEVLGMKAEITV